MFRANGISGGFQKRLKNVLRRSRGSRCKALSKRCAPSDHLNYLTICDLCSWFGVEQTSGKFQKDVHSPIKLRNFEFQRDLKIFVPLWSPGKTVNVSECFLMSLGIVSKSIVSQWSPGKLLYYQQNSKQSILISHGRAVSAGSAFAQFQCFEGTGPGYSHP